MHAGDCIVFKISAVLNKARIWSACGSVVDIESAQVCAYYSHFIRYGNTSFSLNTSFLVRQCRGIMRTVISWKEVCQYTLFNIAIFKIVRGAIIKYALVVGKFLLRVLYKKVFTFVD